MTQTTEPGDRRLRRQLVTIDEEWTLFCQWPDGMGCHNLIVSGDADNPVFNCCGEGNWRELNCRVEDPYGKIVQLPAH